MNPADKIKMALLAAKLAKESLELLMLSHLPTAKLQFRQIVMDLKALDEHLESIH